MPGFAQSKKSSNNRTGKRAASPAKRGAASGKTMAKRRKSPATGRALSRQPYGLLWLPVFVMFLMLSGLAVFYVWERIKLREISREIVELQKTKKLLIEENGRLQAQAEELSSYRRIYKIATERFDFIELKPKIIYTELQKK